MDHIRPFHPAPPAHVVLDITRLLVRAKRNTPSGIDRFEFAYADWLVNDPRPASFLVQWRGRLARVDRAAVARLVTDLRARWMGPRTATADPQLQRCLAFLADRPQSEAAPGMANRPARRRLAETARLLGSLRTASRPDFTGPVAGPAVYLNIGHWHLERLAGLRHRIRPAGVRIVTFVHDLLPIEVPEYFSANGYAEAQQRMAATACNADLVLFTSEAMKHSFASYAARSGLPVPGTVVVPPGIESCFGANAAAPPRPNRPYFVVCGNIEARKNHLLLLGIWRALVAREGARAPRLVVVGRRGWHAESVLSALDRSPLIGTSVIEISDLGTVGLATLLSGARALLMPSFAEGYGMPVAEARACGVPVICSDIPAHREAGGTDALYLDPIDGIGWMREIKRLAAVPEAARSPAGVMRWPQHFARLEHSLAAIPAAG